MEYYRNKASVDGGRLSVVPNLFTLLNLIFGCLAIVCVLQQGLLVTTDETTGQALISVPEKMYWASIFIGCAAIIDFLDGFIARLFKATSELGKQLDSLADVVSFGVAPGMIVYEFLRMSFAQQENGLEISALWLLPAFIIPAAGAYRLARFNIDTTQGYGFKGVPIPAAGLLVASFPLIYWHTNIGFIITLFINQWFWYAIIIIVSYLMVSSLPMLALKFKNASSRSLLPFILLLIVALVCAFLLGWLAVPITFAAYVIISLVFKQNQHDL